MEIDNAHIILSEEEYNALVAALEAPPRELPRLKALFQKRRVFETPTLFK